MPATSIPDTISRLIFMNRSSIVWAPHEPAAVCVCEEMKQPLCQRATSLDHGDVWSKAARSNAPDGSRSFGLVRPRSEGRSIALRGDSGARLQIRDSSLERQQLGAGRLGSEALTHLSDLQDQALDVAGALPDLV